MSGLFSAIGQGISAAGYAAGDMYARQSLLEKQGEIEFERQTRLEEFKATLSEKTRKAQVSRIDTKAGELADERLAPTRGLIDAGIADRSSWTPEHQAAVDQSLGIRRKDLAGKLRTEAAIATGDISAKDAASIEGREEALVYKTLLEEKKEEARAARETAREDRRDARQALTEEGRDRRLAEAEDGRDRRSAERLEALAERLTKGGDSNARMLAIVENQRKELDSRSRELRQLQKDEVSAAIGPAAKKAVTDKYKPEFADLERQRQEARQDYDFLREKLGMPKRGGADAPAPAAAPRAAPSAAPAPRAAPAPAAKTSQRDTSNSDSPASIINAEYRKTKERLTQVSDPQERARLERDILSLQAEAKRGKFTLNDAPPKAAAAPPASGARRTGETRTIAAGPHKGKTAVWDGQGWKLK